MRITPIPSKRRFFNRRFKTILIVVLALAILATVTVAGITMDPERYATNFSEKNQPPSLHHLFGTDWMGRDMFIRTVTGLSTSIYIGLMASIVTSVVALLLGVLASKPVMSFVLMPSGSPEPAVGLEIFWNV